MHRLLQRQLKRHIGSTDAVPQAWEAFVGAVDEAYQQADHDRAMLERSLELTSQELIERNRQLEHQVTTAQERSNLIEEQCRSLQNVVQSVALGNLDIKVEIPQGIEVLSDLAIGLEMMIGDLREMLAERIQTQLVVQQSQALLDIIQSVAMGDLDVQIEIPEGAEVLSDLGIGMEMMIDDLRETLSAQERARAEAEEARRQAESALEQVLAVQRRYTRQEWEQYVSAPGTNRGYQLAEGEMEPTAHTWLAPMTAALQRIDTVAESGDPHGATLALPIHLHGEVIGVVGLSREKPDPWEGTEIALVETIIDQVAQTLENQRLFEQTQAALHEMEATQRRYLTQAWTQYTATQAITGYEQNKAGTVPLGTQVLPEVEQAVTEQRTLVQEGNGDTDSSVVTIPILLRGQPIGALGLRDKGGREWSAADIALAESVSEQFALAAENLRLLDETQRRATREQLTREITDRMRRAATIEDIIQTALDELFDTLGTSRAFVRLRVTPSSQDAGGNRQDRHEA